MKTAYEKAARYADPVESEDARIATFRKLLEAVDTADWRTGLEATRTLRKLGWSVVQVAAPRSGGQR